MNRGWWLPLCLGTALHAAPPDGPAGGKPLQDVLAKLESRFGFRRQLAAARAAAFVETREAELLPGKAAARFQADVGDPSGAGGELSWERGPWIAAAAWNGGYGDGPRLEGRFTRDWLDATPGRRSLLDTLGSLARRIARLEWEEGLVRQLRHVLQLRSRQEKLEADRKALEELLAQADRLDSLVSRRSGLGMAPGSASEEILLLLSEFRLKAARDSLEWEGIAEAARNLYGLEAAELAALDLESMALRLEARGAVACPDEIDSLRYAVQRLEFEFKRMAGAPRLHAGPAFTASPDRVPSWRDAGIFLGFSVDLGPRRLTAFPLAPAQRSSLSGRPRPSDAPGLPVGGVIPALDQAIDRSWRASAFSTTADPHRPAELLRRKLEVFRAESELRETGRQLAWSRLFRLSQLAEP